MESLLDPDESQKVIDRISKLEIDASPKWGQMNAAQMLLHLQKPLEVAIGRLNLKHGLIGFLFGKIAKKQMIRDGFKKNLPTDKAFLVKDIPDFYQERSNLIALIKSYTNGGEDGITKGKHPFFGKMNTDEWDVLLWKHFDHHLVQFGV